MRIKREETSVYHVIGRVVAGEMLLDGGAKEVLRRMLWQVAAFSGVEVLSYCVMTNHLHILVRVPEARAEDLDRAELLRRYRLLYADGKAGFFPDPEVMATILADAESEESARWESRLRARMNDLSAFMKTLKQRFSWWYNKKYKRFGTLWAERFKSVLVEDDPQVLKVVAAYIDLNPVRAGLVEDPGDYRWSGYGEAMGGQELAQAGLATVLGQRDWREAVADYRMVLFGKGGQGRAGEQGAIAPERVEAVLASGGHLPQTEVLRRRVRYMTQGAVLGSEAFVRREGSRLTSGMKAKQKSLGKVSVAGETSLRSWRLLRDQSGLKNVG